MPSVPEAPRRVPPSQDAETDTTARELLQDFVDEATAPAEDTTGTDALIPPNKPRRLEYEVRFLLRFD